MLSVYTACQFPCFMYLASHYALFIDLIYLCHSSIHSYLQLFIDFSMVNQPHPGGMTYSWLSQPSACHTPQTCCGLTQLPPCPPGKSNDVSGKKRNRPFCICAASRHICSNGHYLLTWAETKICVSPLQWKSAHPGVAPKDLPSNFFFLFFFLCVYLRFFLCVFLCVAFFEGPNCPLMNKLIKTTE